MSDKSAAGEDPITDAILAAYELGREHERRETPPDPWQTGRVQFVLSDARSSSLDIAAEYDAATKRAYDRVSPGDGPSVLGGVMRWEHLDAFAKIQADAFQAGRDQLREYNPDDAEDCPACDSLSDQCPFHHGVEAGLRLSVHHLQAYVDGGEVPYTAGDKMDQRAVDLARGLPAGAVPTAKAINDLAREVPE